MRSRRLLFLFVLLTLLLSGCQPVRPLSAAPSGPIPPVDQFVDPTPTPIFLIGPVTVALAPSVPETLAVPMLTILAETESLLAGNGPQPLRVLDSPANANVQIELGPLRTMEWPLIQRFFAVVAPFATVQDDISLEELQARWMGENGNGIYVTEEVAELLAPILGPIQGMVISQEQMLTALEANPGALGVIPFNRIDPRYKVLTVDGQNVLSNQLDPAAYPLAVALSIRGEGAPLVGEALDEFVRAVGPATNRDASRLTTLVMTGVTAMSRGTAAVMEQYGYTYPAAVISDTLAAADITHVSNEVPFLDDCVVNNTVNNLVLCSDTTYWAALEAIGTDIVGLSGNHVNDFGYGGAERSIAWYRQNGIPIYGSGLNVTEACEPLLWEHSGNRFAFVAALAFGPETAWATDDLPGACYYYDHKDEVLATVRALAEQVDVVAVELQYLETYNAFPTGQQVIEFREVRDAGADIVTGVQSHVPQAQEPYGMDDAGGSGFISYGLGNLFFDQMWSWETRTELFARHTIYQGRVINTEILTAVLENFAQPRWATPEERAEILARIFDAAPVRPVSATEDQ